jgi:hypothetical protein
LATTSGRAATVVVGVRRDAGTPFGAHAWVEIGGVVHAERADPTTTFQPIASYPLAPSGKPMP